MTRILIVEDNASIAQGLQSAIEFEGHETRIAVDGIAGLEHVRSWRPTLIILDLMLPLMDGYELLRTIRSEQHTMPVLILSARSDEVEKVRGFRIGADDYVTKPFGLQELLARIDALHRRHERSHEASAVPSGITIGQLHIDLSSRTASLHGNAVELRPKEFDLLWAIVRRRGAIATREDLRLEVWGYAADVYSRTIDTHVLALRRKLEQSVEVPDLILTVRKSGYRLAIERCQ